MRKYRRNTLAVLLIAIAVLLAIAWWRPPTPDGDVRRIAPPREPVRAVTITQVLADAEKTAPEKIETDDGAVPIKLLEKYDKSVGVRADRGIAHIEEPAKINVVIPEVGEFTSHSRRTTMWMEDDRVITVTILPMKETATFKEARAQLERLLEQWGIDPREDPDERVGQILDKWDKIKPPESGYTSEKYGFTLTLSEKTKLVVWMRQGPVSGWYLALDFSASNEAVDWIRKSKRDSIRRLAEERFAAEVLKGADTPAEQFARIDEFLSDPPLWFQEWIESGGRQPADDNEKRQANFAFVRALSEIAVGAAGAKAIDRLEKANVSWGAGAAKYPEALHEYIQDLDPVATMANEQLFDRLVWAARHHPEVVRLFELWLDDATNPSNVEKLVEALERSTPIGSDDELRMIELMKHERPLVQLAAARRLKYTFYRDSLQAVEKLLEDRRDANADPQELEELEAIVTQMRSTARLERKKTK